MEVRGRYLYVETYGTAEQHKVYCIDVVLILVMLIKAYNPYMESLKKYRYYDHSSNEYIGKYLRLSVIFHDIDLGINDIVRKYYDKYCVKEASKQMYNVLEYKKCGDMARATYVGASKDMLAAILHTLLSLLHIGEN